MRAEGALEWYARPMRGALLDRDGVLLLLDEEALYRKALELAAQGAGLERSLGVLARTVRALNEAVRALRVRTLEEEEALWRSLVLEAAQELRVPEERLLPWRYYRFMKRAPGAEALLGGLRAMGLRIGVLSNTLPSLRESLAHHGLDGYVDGFFASITTGKPQLLVLDGADVPLIRGKKVAIVDDVVSTGSTLAGLRELIESVGGQVVAVLTVFTEGTPRQDVIALGHLPLFKPE